MGDCNIVSSLSFSAGMFVSFKWDTVSSSSQQRQKSHFLYYSRQNPSTLSASVIANVLMSQSVQMVSHC